MVSNPSSAPNITLSKILPPDFLAYFHEQCSMYYNLIQHNLNHHQLKEEENTQLTIVLRTIKLNWSYYTKSLKFSIRNSPLLYTIIQKKRASTLPTSVGQCYELTIESHKKPDFQSLYLHTFYPNKRNCSCGISLSRDSIQDDPDYQEIPEDDLLILPSNRISHFS